MKRIAFGLTVAAVLALGAGGTAAAGPTCSDVGLDVKNHGEHVTRDYVRTFGNAAGGDPAHRDSPPAPGASFCVSQSESPGFHVP